MSEPVDLGALRDAVAEQGPVTYLVTVNDDETAHVVSVVPRNDGDRLVVGTGRKTRANLERRPQVTLLWPPGPDPAYSLIVDATVVSVDGEDATLEPHAAILHRVAGAAGDGPTCLTLDG